jgi:acyl carrier protein
VTDEEIYRGLTEVFHDIFDDPELVLTDKTSAADIPAWTSFVHISIIVAAEQRFAVKFTTSQIESLKNVGDLVAMIRAVGSKR